MGPSRDRFFDAKAKSTAKEPMNRCGVFRIGGFRKRGSRRLQQLPGGVGVSKPRMPERENQIDI